MYISHKKYWNTTFATVYHRILSSIRKLQIGYQTKEVNKGAQARY